MLTAQAHLLSHLYRDNKQGCHHKTYARHGRRNQKGRDSLFMALRIIL